MSACGKEGVSQNNQGEVNLINKNSSNDSILDDDSDYLLEEEATFNATMEDILEKGKSMQCTVEVEEDGAKLNAHYYFDGKKDRTRIESEYIAPNEGVSFNSVNIIKDDWSYFWDDTMNTEGMKINLSEEEEDDYEDDYEDEVDMDEMINFKCKPWRIDSSKFDLSKDKEFKNFNEMTYEPHNYEGDFNDDSEMSEDRFTDIDFCSICQEVPAGSERDDCLEYCK